MTPPGTIRPSGYAALWCKSNFSFLEGASHPEELVERAHQLGLDAVALTDQGGVYGVVRAHERARELGVRLLVGAQLNVDDHPLVLLATSRDGYAQLCRLLTVGRLASAKGQCRVSVRQVCEHAAGLVGLWQTGPHHALHEAFGDRLYALLARHRHSDDGEDEARRRATGLPTVAGNEVLYHSPARRPLQDIVTCIRHGCTLYEAGRRIRPNAEHDLKSPHSFAALYADDPGAVERTREVAARCNFSIAQLRYRYPSERLPDGTTSMEWLRELCRRGARQRYHGTIPDDVAAQLDKELSLIEELDYSGYFLTMYEIVQFCAAQNILCQGRGSAANSVVCYCLEITAVDPVRMKLLFERFISRERAEPPDIDLDIEHDRREEVIQHVYEKYGRARAAMVCNVIRYRTRSAIRDVGKAFGLSETTLDRLAKLATHHDSLDGLFAQADVDVRGLHQQLFERSAELLNFPRHLSIHPGGFVLGHEPVDTLVPIENATMEKRTVIQWDKDDVESAGLFKLDLLGLGALTQLHQCFDLVAQHHGQRLTIATVPEGDAPTYALIQRADTVGVFQIESRAQMSMLPRLLPKNYYDLVIEVSIVRPGPITGGMVHPYLQRRENPALIDYPHPSLERVLEKTLGVPLFQEQVMQIAVVAADYTPGEADQLRRDMAAWRKTGRIEQHQERLTSAMVRKGITPEFAERIFKQICGFGEYGFPESHAASFALISYAGSYLKCHYPAEFACSLLNAQPMGFYTPSTIVEDAQRHGVVVRPIDVTRSDWSCTIERDGEKSVLRMGLRYVGGLRKGDGDAITKARPFASLDDFTHRLAFGTKALTALAEAGAFDALDVARRSALWHVRRSAPLPLPVDIEPPVEFEALSALEMIDWDYRRAQHSTYGHPLAPLRADLSAQGLPDARTVAQMSHGQRVRYAGLVICRQHPGTASGVTFMTLEDETGFVNLVVWRRVFEQHLVLAKTQPFLGVSGQVQAKDGVVHIVAETLFCPNADELPAHGKSRDFH